MRSNPYTAKEARSAAEYHRQLAAMDDDCGLPSDAGEERRYADTFDAYAHQLESSTERWQAIETAPKDGREVLLCVGEPRLAIIGRYENRGWINVMLGVVAMPTLWAPFPPVPAEVPALRRYLDLENKLLGLAEGDADRVLDVMDDVWSMLSPDEQAWLNARTPATG